MCRSNPSSKGSLPAAEQQWTELLHLHPMTQKGLHTLFIGIHIFKVLAVNPNVHFRHLERILHELHGLLNDWTRYKISC